jgi:hypothetical protein
MGVLRQPALAVQPDRGPATPDAAAGTLGRCGNRSPVQGWTLIGAIAIYASNLPLAVQAARHVRSLPLSRGHCRIGGVTLCWMRLPQFYRHIGAVP